MSGYARSEEPALILRIQQGDGTAFEQIVHKNHARLLCRARKFVTDHEQAEDAVQNAYIKAWKSLVQGRFKAKSSVDSWLYTIVSNTARDERKRLKRKAHEQIRDSLGRDNFTMYDDPLIKLEKSELKSIIFEESEHLPLSQRQIFLTRTMIGLNYNQIAKKYGYKIGTIKGELHRARKKMKRRLENIGITRITPSDRSIRDRYGKRHTKV